MKQHKVRLVLTEQDDVKEFVDFLMSERSDFEIFWHDSIEDMGADIVLPSWFYASMDLHRFQQHLREKSKNDT